MPNQANKQAFFEMMTRVYRTFGCDSLDPRMFEAVEPIQREQVAIWVNQLVGNDEFEGSQSRPFKTLNRAIKEITVGLATLVTINVARGNYVEHLKLLNLYGMGGGLKIIGTDWDTFTTTTGPNSGTITTVTDRIVSVLGTPGWTVGEMEGSFLKITSGPLNNKLLPIYTNTSNTIEISAFDSSLVTYSSGLNGQTFSIVKPGATITKPLNDGNDAAIVASCLGGANYVHGVTPADNGLIFQNLSFNGNGAARFFWISGSIQFINCVFPGATPGGNPTVTGAAFASLAKGSSCSWVNCYVRAAAIVSTRGFFEQLAVDGCIFRCTIGHVFDIFNSSSIDLRMNGVSSILETNANGLSGTAIWSIKGLDTGNVNVSITSGVIIKNCDHVIKACAHAIRFSSILSPMIVERASYNGFWIFDDVIGASGHSTFWVYQLKMNNIVGDGGNGPIWGNAICVQAPYVNIVLYNSEIRNCPTSGIQMGGRVQTAGRDAGCFGNLYLYSCTMSNNGSGGDKDITLDGGASYMTLTAAQNAANSGTTVNSVLFNRVRANPVGV